MGIYKRGKFWQAETGIDDPIRVCIFVIYVQTSLVENSKIANVDANFIYCRAEFARCTQLWAKLKAYTYTYVHLNID